MSVSNGINSFPSLRTCRLCVFVEKEIVLRHFGRNYGHVRAIRDEDFCWRCRLFSLQSWQKARSKQFNVVLDGLR